jgi:hypothetical protein
MCITTWSNMKFGCAVAQAVSCWLPTAVAWVRVRAACKICGGQNGTGASFFRVLRFPLPIIPPISPSQSPRAGTVGLLVATVPSGHSWTPPPQYINLKKSEILLLWVLIIAYNEKIVFVTSRPYNEDAACMQGSLVFGQIWYADNTITARWNQQD